MHEMWIPILDYAVLKGISTSTLRRYIKANKIAYKVENGRYLLKADTNPARTASPDWSNAGVADSVSVYSRVRELEDQLVQAQEQINELKMLVAIYEEKLSHSDN